MMFTRLVFTLILVGSCLSEETPERSIEGTPNPLACEYEELKGYWFFDVGEGGYDKTINCMTSGSTTDSISPATIIYSLV